MLDKISLNFLNIYQRFFRIIWPCACRFYPSCSEYAKQAILKHGFLNGWYKSIGRLLSCHPFSGKAGYDPLI